MVAPRTESANEPAMPPRTVAMTTASDQPGRAATVPMRSAPTTEASVPRAVTAPDVPGGTGCHRTTCRGEPGASEPISVPQVSLAALASAPPPTAYQPGQGRIREPAAASVNR